MGNFLCTRHSPRRATFPAFPIEIILTGTSIAGRPFEWKIDGFSTLMEVPLDCHYSGTFCAKGYKWKLSVYPKYTKKEDGRQYISLFLSLDTSSLRSDLAGVRAVFKLWIADQLDGYSFLRRTLNEHGFWCMMSHKDFMDTSSGFLVNDSCIFGVDIMKVSAVKIRSASEVLSVLKNRTPVKHIWSIKDFSKKSQKQQNSESFSAGGYNWHITLVANECTKFLSVCLELDHSTTLAPESRVYVDFSLCLMDRRNGDHKEHKCIGQKQYSLKDSKCGWLEFLPLEDFRNPAYGFLKEDECIVKASVTVLGSVTTDSATSDKNGDPAVSPQNYASGC